MPAFCRSAAEAAWHGASTIHDHAFRGAAFQGFFSADRVRETGPTSASEDFGSFGAQWRVPSAFWFVGVTDRRVYARAKAAGEINKLPSNHSPFFAPVMHPSLETGVETLVVGALAWLGKADATPPAATGA